MLLYRYNRKADGLRVFGLKTPPVSTAGNGAEAVVVADANTTPPPPPAAVAGNVECAIPPPSPSMEYERVVQPAS